MVNRLSRLVGDCQFRANEENEEKYIEGYFVVFNSPYWFSKTDYETISPDAFNETLDDDIRALVNHDSTLVIGRTSSKTLELRLDEHGLWGRIVINPNDTDALNIYARVQRGDVSQCSFGFEILDEETELLEDGGVHWTVKKVRLHEVSVVTFPAYEDTEVTARCKKADELREVQSWRIKMLAKLKGEQND